MACGGENSRSITLFGWTMGISLVDSILLATPLICFRSKDADLFLFEDEEVDLEESSSDDDDDDDEEEDEPSLVEFPLAVSETIGLST